MWSRAVRRGAYSDSSGLPVDSIAHTTPCTIAQRKSPSKLTNDTTEVSMLLVGGVAALPASIATAEYRHII